MWNRPDYGPIAKIKVEKQSKRIHQCLWSIPRFLIYFFLYKNNAILIVWLIFRWLTWIRFFFTTWIIWMMSFWFLWGQFDWPPQDLSILKEPFISVWPSADEGMVDVSDRVWQMTGRGSVKSRKTHRQHVSEALEWMCNITASCCIVACDGVCFE